MGKDPGPDLPPFRKLSPAEQARTLDKLRRLETDVMFTPEWDEVGERIGGWVFAVRINMLFSD